MPEVKIQIDDLAIDVRDRVTDAIMEHLNESKKDELIKAALDNLIKPLEGTHYCGRNMVEHAFFMGVEKVAHEIANEAVKENRNRIVLIVKEAVNKALADEKISDGIARSMVQFWTRGY